MKLTESAQKRAEQLLKIIENTFTSDEPINLDEFDYALLKYVESLSNILIESMLNDLFLATSSDDSTMH